jgi:RecB family exonuclease
MGPDGKTPRRAQHAGLFGRADYAGRDVEGNLRVLDLKTGDARYLQMPLLAWQLRAYAVMAWEHTGKKDEPVLLSFAAVRAACREHAQLAWEPACPNCRMARPTSRATPQLLQAWAVQLRAAIARARQLVAGAEPVFKPHPKHCGRCRARPNCPAFQAALEKAQALPVVSGK